MLGHWRHERAQRVAEARAAAAKSERLALVIEHLSEEARAVGAWAQARYEENHLTNLFFSGRRR